MSSSKRLAIVTVLAAVIIAGIALSAIFTVQGLPPGTTLAGEPVSDPSKASQTVKTIHRNLANKQVTIKAGDKETTVTLKELGFSLSEAVMITKVQSHVGFNAWIDSFVSGSPSIPIEFNVYKPANPDSITSSLRTEVQDGDLTYANGKVTATKAVVGISVTYEAIKRSLEAELIELSRQQDWPEPIVISPAVKRVQPSIPQELIDSTAGKLRRMLDTPMTITGTIVEEGQYKQGEVVLTSEDIAPALKIVKDPSAIREADRLQIVKATPIATIPQKLVETVSQGSIFPKLKVHVENRTPPPPKGSTEAQVTTIANIKGNLVATEGEAGFMANPELTYYSAIQAILEGRNTSRFVGTPIDGTDLASIGVREPISTYTTYFTPGQGRNKNIKRITEIVNGTIIPAGSHFELNHFVGQRTEAKGFGPGGAILDGKMITDIGGGVSQFATTFFNAMWFSGVEIVEFHPHTYHFSRYPLGREATIDFPNVNLEMRNNTPYAIVVNAVATEESVTVTFWSTPYYTITQELGEATPTDYGSRVVIKRTVKDPHGESKTSSYTVNYKRP